MSRTTAIVCGCLAVGLAIGLWWFFQVVPTGQLPDGTPVFRPMWDRVGAMIILGVMGIWLIIKGTRDKTLR